ncbi:MAG: P pilus assembly/Cpx signaling pathway, periplasmic inhibitor/zinc-resistance associated protein [Richelia sp. RM2_1_2]|nr:P pilus assembly/Cpx signaling pathway, periplasmic inhibitor/zinc-resistance associated protein [Richelia sp. SM1_7_0]NJN09535.1 P pilus assembly/Cpx signaling pathway, periplasmic inhibitor/zinc-resistance associated protein [Richelia sp. RM1_1_1]NJO59212.1 P pilus assembly/Cpx signaling pathway, periplasmic inhibitor/zinc-resistance associated protein [Richelia sp. RM2_1_2]
MKFKLLSVLIVTTAAITTTASVLNAQFPPSQGQFPGKQGFPNKEQGFFKELNLTQDQKDKLKEIQEENKSALDEILTSEQRETLKEAVTAGKKPPEAMQSLDLSDEQKQQIQEVMESQKQKIAEILTPEQQEKLRDRMEKMHDGKAPGGLPPQGFGRFPSSNAPIGIPPQG